MQALANATRRPELLARSDAALARAQLAIEHCDLALAQAQALARRLDGCCAKFAAARVQDPAGPLARRSKRNKLVHKNRWLISVNVVAALRRAGVDCDIVVPPEAGEP
jgi:hypothetical protein